jgi:flavin reductase (DIM6/NTAB) family NADH-FMN oxidoreductase RutF
MTEGFNEFDPDRLEDNVFRLMGRGWFLFTAGTIERWNTMTAAWGGLGFLWERRVAFGFVRPQRHTFGFVEKHAHFTFCFFDERHRAILEYCGSHSGRDVDKAAATGLVPVAGPDGTVLFAQARLALVCRKIHTQDIDPGRFLDPALHAVYPGKDYHRMYVGEIVKCLAHDTTTTP